MRIGVEAKQSLCYWCILPNIVSFKIYIIWGPYDRQGGSFAPLTPWRHPWFIILNKLDITLDASVMDELSRDKPRGELIGYEVLRS
jgi:hypothetical protein